MYIYIYTYIYREREIYTYIYIYIYQCMIICIDLCVGRACCMLGACMGGA